MFSFENTEQFLTKRGMGSKIRNHLIVKYVHVIHNQFLKRRCNVYKL